MAVESRFVVIRQGVEVETFMDKKSADEYDKMLDMADNLTEMFEGSSLNLTEALAEELSIFLAKERENVLIALQAKKAPVAKKAPAAKAVKTTAAEAEIAEAKQEVADTKKPAAKKTATKKSAA